MAPVFLFFLCLIGAEARAEEGAGSPCDSMQTIAEEFVAFELAGGRWQGGDSPCLAKLKLKTRPTKKLVDLPDPSLLDPEFLLPSKRKVEVQVKRLPNDQIGVKIHYLGRKYRVDLKNGANAGSDVPVNDHLVLRLNFNQERDKKGCASLQSPPAHLVMRQECAAD